jgi:predicted PurR-regulated permease PerM
MPAAAAPAGSPLPVAEVASPARRLRWFFLASAALSFYVAWDLIVPLGIGAVFAFASERPVDAILARLPRPERLRTLVSILFVTLALVLVFLPVSLALYIAINDLIKLIAQHNLHDWLLIPDRFFRMIGLWAGRFNIELPVEQVTGRLTDLVASNLGAAGSVLGSVLSGTPNALFNGGIVLLCWVGLLLEGKQMRGRLLPRLIPWPREREILCAITAEVVESVIVANVLVSAVQGALCAVALLVFGVPRAFIGGVVAFFFSFVPVVGTLPITLGAVTYCLSQGRIGAAVGMLIVAVVVGTVDNFLRPFFMRSSADLSMLWVLVSFVGGLSAFGLPGVILGPLAFSLFLAFLTSLEQEERRAPPA